MVDTCAAEFESYTPYYYSTYSSEDEVKPQGENAVIVFGSGPIRIGQGIEFDYCSVHASWALRGAGKKSIVINNNPETVSTDFDTSDSLYLNRSRKKMYWKLLKRKAGRRYLPVWGTDSN